MNAPFDSQVQVAGPTVAPNSGDAAHIFRSKILDRCAAVEGWALNILKTAAAVGVGTPSDKGDRHLFGRKLELVKSLAEEEPSFFEAPNELLTLLCKFKGYSGLRRVLAHSTIQVSIDLAGTKSYVFELACETSEAWPQRFVLTHNELRRATSQNKKIANELIGQKLARRA